MSGEASKKRVLFRATPVKTSPCTVKCPLGTNVKAYVSLVAAGRFAEALEVVRQTNPFPGICGRVCPHPCEDDCRRGDIDDPVAIAALKRFIADYELRSGVIPRYKREKSSGERLAIIGAGPAGLTCAADLAREGHEVTVFEALPVPGGMMVFGIPAYRLPRDILRIEIAAIEALGVEIKLNSPIGLKPSFEELVRDFDAVFIAVGAQSPLGLSIEGAKEVDRGLIDWVSLLRDVSSGQGKKPGDRVVIIGGGNTAVDCARVSLRLGAKDIQLVYRRSRREMPAYEEEVDDAQEEGVKFRFLTGPVRLLQENGRLSGIECVHMRPGEMDESGRCKPIPISGPRFTISCDAVIPAIGQKLDASFDEIGQRLGISRDGLLVVDPETMAASMRGVFSGGDAVTGAGSVVDAIASGHRAAKSIVRYINGLPLGSSNPPLKTEPGELEIEGQYTERIGRVKNSRIAMTERRSSFKEVDFRLTEEQAMAEAARCIRCGSCLECVRCVGICDKKLVIVKDSDKSEMLVRLPLDIYRKPVSKLRYNLREYEPYTFTVSVNELMCRGCGLCEEVCGYHAIQVLCLGDGIFYAKVNDEVCRGCGTCVSVCPTGAIDQQYFTRERMQSLINGMVKGRGIVVVACRWSFSKRVFAGGAGSEAVSVMCTGRLTAGNILKAFKMGARAFLIVGCADEACHYGFGKTAAKQSVRRASDVLSLLGYTGERVRMIDIPEGDKVSLESIIEEIEG